MISPRQTSPEVTCEHLGRSSEVVNTLVLYYVVIVLKCALLTTRWLGIKLLHSVFHALHVLYVCTQNLLTSASVRYILTFPVDRCQLLRTGQCCSPSRPPVHRPIWADRQMRRSICGTEDGRQVRPDRVWMLDALGDEESRCVSGWAGRCYLCWWCFSYRRQIRVRILLGVPGTYLSPSSVGRPEAIGPKGPMSSAQMI